MNTKKLSLVLLSVIMALALCAFAACNRGGDDTYKAGEEVGSYYCVVNGAEAKLTLAEDGTATLVLGDENFSGPCQKDKDNPNKLTMTFGESSDLLAQATYANNVMTVSFRSTEYRFLRDVEYTVTFNSNGGSAVNSVPVRNGKTVAKPADPKKGDLIFLGWYKDNDTFKEPYQFGAEAVTGNITLYACYGESAEGEFDVTYNPGFDGGEVKSLKTSNGIAEILAAPSREGYEFLGWYVSDYEDPSKLTYKYEGQTLYQNTVLYGAWESDAPAVSISNNKITWNSLGGRGTYNVFVYDAQGELLASGQTQNLYYDFDFSALPAGEYSARVTYRGVSGNAYLKNKALPKVSLFKVANGTALTFNSVANAAEYVISIDCGNKYHKHSELSNGLSTTYNFANCDMQKGGIKFTVTANADGYLSSVSKEFVFEQGLAAVTGLKATDDGKLTWNAVENAESYLVTIKAGESEQTLTVKTTELSIKEYGMGAMTFAVQPLANNYYSPEASMCNYQKSTLASPKNIMLNQTTLVWEGEQGATYNVKIGDKVYKANTNSMALEESYFSGSNRTVSIQTIKGTSISLYSDPVTVKSSLTEDMVSYANGYVTWGNVFGAVSYRVDIEPGNISRVVTGDVHSLKLDFEGSGEYTVKVSAFGNGVSGAVTLNLSVYSVYYESNGGTTVSTSYLVKGDYLTLPESAKGGYDFTGWYNAVGGASSNGKEYNDGEFTYTSDVTMYANWTPKPINITIKWKDGDQELTDTQTVYYKEQYTLPVPQIEPNGYAFGGWYLGSIQYTDQNGKSLISFDRIEDITLEADFVEVLKFDLLKDGSGYSVKKGDYINQVSEVTIPAMYNNKPVLTIEPSAFISSSYLKVINIPDTVNDMFISVEGLTSTGSSFQGCSKLEAINVYATDVDSPDKGRYYSEDGVLYRYNNDTQIELYAYPTARMGDFVIADGVQSLRSNVFKSAKMSSITIPSSVTYIEAEAFASNSNLTNVVFEPAKEGEVEQDLVIDDEAFYLCSNLLEITLPTRMQTYNKNMFRSCNNLSSVYFTDDNGKYKSLDGVVTTTEEDGSNVLVWYPYGRQGDYVIPSGITKIGDFAFTTRFESTSTTATNPYIYYGNKNIERITIPAWVTYIGEGAFRGCNKVKEVNFLGTATDNALTIEKDAFYGLTNEEFTEVTLPENLKYLGESAFGYCSKLLTVNLNSVDCSEFQTGAFGYVSTGIVTNFTYYVTTLNIGKDTGAIEIAGVFGIKLEVVNVDPNNQNYEVIDNVVYDKAVTSVLFYPAEKQGAYTTPATVTNIGANVFKDRTGLTEVTIGKNVTSIGTNAFGGCTALTTVTFEQGGEAALIMGDGVFKGCNNLAAIAIPERTTEVGSELLFNCNKLQSVSLPATLENIHYGYDSTLKIDIFNMFSGSKSYLLEEITVAPENKKYASKDGILYEKNAEGALVTLLYCPSGKIGVVDAPKTITKIAPKAFAYSNATKLMFSQGIEQGAELVFGEQVFYNSALTEVELPEGLTAIADQMFYYNEELVKVTIPSTATSIGVKAFYWCKALETVVIPNSVETIKERAFYGCSSLQTITIPNSVKTIEKVAFGYCTNLSEIIFAAGNDEVDADGAYVNPLTFADAEISSSGSYGSSYYGVFYSTKVGELIFPARTTYIGTYLMGYADYDGSSSSSENTSLKKVVIPSTIEGIGKNAFYYCVALETVEFSGNGVSKLADTNADITKGAAFNNTFYGCDALKTIINLPESSSEEGYSLYSAFAMTYNGGDNALTEVEIPASVKAMKSAFSRNGGLKKVTFRAGSKLETLDSCFEKCTSLTGIELPNGLKTIGNNAFSGLSSLKSIVIPTTVTTIGYNAFNGCSSLTSITFATYSEGENAGKCSLESIGYQAFAGTAITEFTFPVSVKDSINLNVGTTSVSNMGRLFKKCNNLTTVTLSKSVTDIEYVLEECPSITTINIADDNDSFTTQEGTPYIYNKDGTGILFLFGAAPKGHLVIPEGITEIAAYVFKGHTGITEVTIPYTVGKIGAGAFDGCMNLTKINFQDTPDKPSALQTVGESAFANCLKLTDVTLPETEGFTLISDKMFLNSGLKSVKIPECIETIGEYAFAFSENLATVDLPLNGKLELFDQYCFYKTALTEVLIPSTVVKIGVRAFQNIQTLKKVEFAKDAQGNTSITTIMGSSFGGSSTDSSKNLESIIIPKSVTTLTGSALSYIPALTSITFEEGSKLTSITSSVFRETGIQSITIPASVTKIESSAFQDCANLTTVILEKGSKLASIGSSAFKGCTLFTGLTFEVSTPLATIDTNAFQDCTSIVSIKIPDTVTAIKKQAFAGCTSLEKVEFTRDSKLKTLGDQVFQDCTSLNSINLPDGSLTIIPQYAFLNCSSLVTIAIPDSVTTFKNYVFSGCTSLETVTFGESSALTTIGTYIFSDYKGTSSIPAGEACTSLKSFDVPDGVTKLGNYMFQNCTALETVTFGEGSKLNFLGTNTFRNSGLKSIEVPKGVTMLGTSATSCAVSSSVYTFANCDRLTSVTFKGNITKIGGYVFFDCNNLVMDVPKDVTVLGTNAFAYTAATSFTIPKGLTAVNMGNAPFGGCSNLTSFKVADGNSTIMVDQATGALLNVADPAAPQVLCYPAGLKGVDGVVTIPDNKGITIDSYAFMGCSDISVVLPSDMETIPAYAFALSKITSFTIPEGVTAIGNYAFDGISTLTTLTLPASLKTIGTYAFRNTTGLTTISMSDGLTSIGNYAFTGSGIESLTIPNTVTTLGTYLFKDCDKLTTVTLPTGLEEIPNYLFQNCTALTSASIPASVTSIGNYAFSGSGIESLTIPDTVTTLGTYLFKDCDKLTTVTLPAGLEAIPTYMFQNCTALETVVIPEGVTSIGTYAFNGAGIKSITIPASVTSIGNYAFRASGLESITVPASVETLGTYLFTDCESLTTAKVETTAALNTYMFSGCTMLSNVTLAEGITSLGNYMFQECTSLEGIKLPESLTFMGTNTFLGSGLKTITIPKSVKAFLSTATAEPSVSSTSNLFKNCVNLTEVILPEGFEAIGSGTFEGCTSLASINIPDSVTHIGNYAFEACSALTEFNMPLSIAEIGYEAFVGCTSIKKLVFEEVPSAIGRDVFEGWTSDQTVCFCFNGTYSKPWTQTSPTNYWFGETKANVVWDYVEA